MYSNVPAAKVACESSQRFILQTPLGKFWSVWGYPHAHRVWLQPPPTSTGKWTPSELRRHRAAGYVCLRHAGYPLEFPPRPEILARIRPRPACWPPAGGHNKKHFDAPLFSSAAGPCLKFLHSDIVVFQPGLFRSNPRLSQQLHSHSRRLPHRRPP